MHSPIISVSMVILPYLHRVHVMCGRDTIISFICAKQVSKAGADEVKKVPFDKATLNERYSEDFHRLFRDFDQLSRKACRDA